MRGSTWRAIVGGRSDNKPQTAGKALNKAITRNSSRLHCHLSATPQSRFHWQMCGKRRLEGVYILIERRANRSVQRALTQGGNSCQTHIGNFCNLTLDP